MAFVTLPAGQSVRAIADRLGVSPEELQRHAGVADAEAPLATERRIEVPDGFLRSRAASAQLKEAVLEKSGRRGGMNSFLALDIEQKRTRAAGGMHAQGAAEQELEALAEAWRTYRRFIADANDLAAGMFEQLTLTHSVAVRAEAFAGQSSALSQRHRLFGLPLERCRPQALSAAKAALMADPKHPEAHLAMALALGCERTPPALREAQAELEAAIRQQPRAGRCWAELAAINEALGEIPDAEAAIEVAMELEPDWLFTLQTAASLALRRGEGERGGELLVAALEKYPEHANLQTYLAMARPGEGKGNGAESRQSSALSSATTAEHRRFLEELFRTGRFPV